MGGARRPVVRIAATATIGCLLLVAGHGLLAQTVPAAAPAATNFEIGVPTRGRVFALVVGINDYKRLPKLRGAVADARDIAGVLQRGGIANVVTLIDGDATRAAFTAAIKRFTAEATAGDLFILSFAGHGSQQPSVHPTASNDGVDEVFMLTNFEPEGINTAERILDKEIYAWLSEFEKKGVSVLFVADSCHSGGMTKAIDPRSSVTYRSVRLVNSPQEAATTPDSYYLRGDRLPEVTNKAVKENMAAEELRHLTFVAAVDKWSRSPEVPAPEQSTPRGAVSYAFARALENGADRNRDGRTTRRELIEHMRDVTANLTERRQNPVFAPLDRLDEVVFTTQPANGLAAAENDTPAGPTNKGISVLTHKRSVPAALRVGVINGPLPDKAAMNLKGRPIELVAGKGGTLDAIWDAATGDVIDTLGDVIARQITVAQLGGVLARIDAVRRLALIANLTPTRLLLTPDQSRFRAKDQASLRLKMDGGRYVVIANIAGDGRLQRVYPLQGDQALLLPPESGITNTVADILIEPPFGSDAMVAVASRRQLAELEQLMIRLQDQLGAKEFVDLLEGLPPGIADISFVSFFSAP